MCGGSAAAPPPLAAAAGFWHLRDAVMDCGDQWMTLAVGIPAARASCPGHERWSAER